MSKKEKLWFIDIKDKVEVGGGRCCPPHYLPHKLPFGKKVTTEPCHIHNSLWRMSHHVPFCKFLGCKNYKAMMKKYREHKQGKSI
jgi:hypothetical protein